MSRIRKTTTAGLDERVQEVCLALGDNLAEIGRQLGVGRQAVQLWTGGTIKNLKLENLFGLADLSGFNPRWIAIGEGAKMGAGGTASEGSELQKDGKTMYVYYLDSEEQSLLNVYRVLFEDQKRELIKHAGRLKRDQEETPPDPSKVVAIPARRPAKRVR